MNRYLAIPLTISLILFSGYLFVETKSQAAIEPIAKHSSAAVAGLSGELVSIDEAQRILAQDWYSESTERKLFTRARPLPPVYAFAQLDQPQDEDRQLFFTGMLYIVEKKEQTSVPVVFDRISRSIFVVHENKWLAHEDWLENHAPDRPAT